MTGFGAALRKLATLPGVPASELPGIAEGIMRLAEIPAEPEAGTSAPRCDPCSRTFVEGRDRNVPAAYWWMWFDDTRTPLCARCCAAWRENTAEDPVAFPVPARVVQIAA